ncbi:MAG: lysylphosphatidylglycerol synthetase family protein [Chitinophagaceae bacterium]|nr:MAG: lysylphosphatidylglycerol synthetase family protein [Chitinophagaceae bacterium]
MLSIRSTWRKIIAGQFYWRELLSILFILVAFYFFRKEQGEFGKVRGVLSSIHISWLLWGILLVLAYIALQALMYVTSFAAVGAKISYWGAIELYLKRNLVGIFLPAGGVTSQTFFKSIPERQQISNTKTNFASYIFVVLGIASVIVVGIPVILYLVLDRGVVGKETWYFLILLVLIIWLCWASWSVYKKGWWYRKLIRIMPQLEVMMNDILNEKVSSREIFYTLIVSILIEFVGITQLYISMRAISPEISFQAALLGYTVATIFLVISPFLKGIGAVELSLIYILTLFGYDTTAAASITLLYRFFNFWLVAVAGLLSFLFNRQSLLLRIFPSLLIFALGFVNLLSGLSPAIHWRMHLIEQYLPVSTVHASNDLVIAAGVVLIVTSAFLLRGLRSAWVIALVVSLVSVVANMTKAIDYEEAIFAAVVCIILIATRNQYQVKSKRQLVQTGLKVAIGVWLTGVIFGIIGFYFMREKNFGVNLTFFQSVKYTLQNFVLLQTDLVPHTKLANGFLRAINVMGVGSIAFLIYTFLRPFVYNRKEEEGRYNYAKEKVEKYGESAVEYFKVYPDKLIFTVPEVDGFISYKTANDFAITLGMPVCENEDLIYKKIIDAFEKYGEQQGLKTAYYRIDEKYLPFFQSLGKRSIVIGQEAMVDLTTFSMEGKKRQNLRTARNNLLKKGYKCHILDPPVPGNILQQLKAVSNDWLNKLGEEEMVFSQGMFLEEEVREHTILYLEAPDGRIVAFLDLIPDYKKGEARYDLIRKLADEYSGCLDMLMVELIFYCKEKNYQTLNMGMAPMSGIDIPKDIRERTIKFAYENIGRFKHYKGLRFFKEKFDPVWENKYMIYEHHFDLVLLPQALNSVMKEF